MIKSVRVHWEDDGDRILAVVDEVQTFDVSDIVDSFDTDAEIIRSVGTFLEEQGVIVTPSTVWDIEEE